MVKFEGRIGPWHFHYIRIHRYSNAISLTDILLVILSLNVHIFFVDYKPAKYPESKLFETESLINLFFYIFYP